MKLKKEFIVHNADGESMLISTGAGSFSGMVRGNKTLGAILELLKEETTEAEIVAGMLQRFDAPEAVIAADVAKAITQLRKIGAIDG